MKHGAWTIRRLRDDAGVRRRVVNPRLRRALRDAEPELRGRLLSARREWMLGQRRMDLTNAVLLILVTIIVCVRNTQRGTPWQSYIAYILLVYAVVAMGWWRGFNIRNDDIRRVALDHDLCPSCAGDLTHLTPAPTSGLVLCDTCGGVWAKADPPKPVICDACGYDLQGLPPGDDGITRCPECGTVWRFGQA